MFNKYKKAQKDLDKSERKHARQERRRAKKNAD